MKNFKVNELHINGKIASGIVRGLIYRITFDFVPTEKEAKKAIREAASYNISLMDMKNAVREYLLSEDASVSDIEDFLDYPISADVLEELETHIDNVFKQMSDEVVREYYRKFH